MDTFTKHLYKRLRCLFAWLLLIASHTPPHPHTKSPGGMSQSAASKKQAPKRKKKKKRKRRKRKKRKQADTDEAAKGPDRVEFLLYTVLFFGFLYAYTQSSSHPASTSATFAPPKARSRQSALEKALHKSLQQVQKAVHLKDKVPYQRWLYKFNPSLKTPVLNLLKAGQLDPTALYKIQMLLLEKRYAYSPVVLSYLLTHCIYAYLSGGKPPINLAEVISGDADNNMLGQALLHHENSQGPIDQTPSQGNLNLIPLIYLLLYFDQDIENPFLHTLTSSKYQGHATLQDLAKTKKLALTNDDFHFFSKGKGTRKRDVPRNWVIIKVIS